MIKPCKYCGSTLHFSYQCYRNPKRGYAIKKRYEKAYKTGKTPKHDKMLSNQSLDRKRLIMELDKYCSLIVRIGASDKYGICQCYCCGKSIPYKMADCAHYISRQKMQSRFDIDLNLRPNCTQCNRLLHGNLKKYREHLVREIGEDKVRELETRPPKKISTPELEELLKEIKVKYKRLLEKKKKSCYN